MTSMPWPYFYQNKSWKNPTHQLLNELIQISSQTQNTLGVKRVQQVIAGHLKELGFEVKFFKGDRRDLAPLLVAERVGIEKKKWISFICHADTVHEHKAMKNNLVKIDQNRARGPGAIDNKGGIVTLIKGLELFLKNSSTHKLGLRIICSPSEEIGSPGLHHIFRHYSRSTVAVLGFEPANSKGDVIGSRQGNRWYDISLKGKEAHAGRDHHKGLNAAYEMAIKTVALQELTNYEDGVTVNVGHVEAGQKKHNIVAKDAKAMIDVRFKTLKQRDEIHQKVLDIINDNQVENDQGKLVESSWKVVDDCPPFQQGPLSKKLFLIVEDLIQKIEKKKVKCLHAGGCADSNHLNRPGMPVLDGLGPVGDGMHTCDEWVDLKSLETRPKVLNQLLQKIMQDKEFHHVP